MSPTPRQAHLCKHVHSMSAKCSFQESYKHFLETRLGCPARRRSNSNLDILFNLRTTSCISFHEDAENEQQLHILTNDDFVLSDDPLKYLFDLHFVHH